MFFQKRLMIGFGLIKVRGRFHAHVEHTSSIASFGKGFLRNLFLMLRKIKNGHSTLGSRPQRIDRSRQFENNVHQFLVTNHGGVKGDSNGFGIILDVSIRRCRVGFVVVLLLLRSSVPHNRMKNAFHLMIKVMLWTPKSSHGSFKRGFGM